MSIGHVALTDALPPPPPCCRRGRGSALPAASGGTSAGEALLTRVIGLRSWYSADAAFAVVSSLAAAAAAAIFASAYRRRFLEAGAPADAALDGSRAGAAAAVAPVPECRQ